MTANQSASLRYLLLPLCLVCDLQAAHAATFSEEDSLDMVFGTEEQVSIATGRQQPIYKAPAIANVISRQDILNSTASTLNELLEMVTGLHVSENYFSGSAITTTRGFHRNPNAGVLFMLNGVSINNLQTGSRPAALQLPLASIERIEIIRGPGSAVHGSDAYVGLVNIITSTPDPEAGFITGVRVGDFGLKNAWFQHAFNINHWDIGYTIESISTDDDDRLIARDLQSFFDDVTGTNASIAPAGMNASYDVYNLMFNASREHWQFRQWLWTNADQGNEHSVPGLDVIDSQGHAQSSVLMSTVEYTNDALTPDWTFNTSANVLFYEISRNQHLLPPGSIAPIGSDGNLFTPGINNRVVTFPVGMIDNTDVNEQSITLEAATIYSGIDAHQLRLAAGYQRQSLDASESKNFGPGVLDGNQSSAPTTLIDVSDTNVFIPDGSRSIVFLSLQDEWFIHNDWTLTAGLRYDRYSDFGDTSNPRLALVWQTNYNLTTKLLYGKAFRAPSYTELFLQNSPGTNGNAALQPESIDTIELSFDYRPTLNIQSIVSFFAYQADNLISSVDFNAAANTKSFTNENAQDGHGIEIELAWDLSRALRLNANYAWQYSTLNGSREEPANAPAQQAYAALKYGLSRALSLNNEIYWVEAGPRALDDARPAADDFISVNTRLRYNNHYDDWEISLIATNLLDRTNTQPSVGNDSITTGSAALPADTPMKPRGLFVEFKLLGQL